jgi:dephospho-CoA kinase
MTLLGVTGGVGMGKSACADFLSARGVPVIDTDILARKVVEPGQPALGEIQKAFGSDIVGPDSRLRREELARRVFPDPAAREQLEAILHPRIRDIWRAQVQIWRSESKHIAAVIIPLLYETHAEADFDATICVACSAATQRQRLQARGWSADQIEQRIQAQWPIEQKITKADYLIWTEGPLDIHASQLDILLRSG